jgi:transposase
MMGHQEPQKDLFSYRIDLDKRVRPDNPLRRIAEKIDFTFIREEVAKFYGKNGHESVDPVIILKMMFLLFYDNVASERELMKIIAERLDYMWFLGYGLNDDIPNHSVLSKARKRWGEAVFEGFFVRTIMHCVEARLVGGEKIHLDASLVDADASKDSVRKSCPELIAALKQAYQAQQSKLEDTSTADSYEAVNDRVISTTDPDAPVVSHRGQGSRPRYHHHRAIDDEHGVITAVETTPGSIAENRKLLELVDQHQANSQLTAKTVVADTKYGTAENFVRCQQRGLTTHMGDLLGKQNHEQKLEGIFPESAFTYRPEDNTYLCPAGKVMIARRLHSQKRTWEYYVPERGCQSCHLRAQCTRAKMGRTLHRHEHQELLHRAREQAHSPEARKDRRRRQAMMEQSFADAANNHGFKRSRWRRLWRQKIQDYLIAGIQNIRILLSRVGTDVSAGAAALKIVPVEAVLMVFLLLKAAVEAMTRRLEVYCAPESASVH